MTIRKSTMAVLFALTVSAPLLYAQEEPAGLSDGLRAYQAGRYEEALSAFVSAAQEARGEYVPYADFWVARSLMALGRYGEASDAFDVFLVDHRSHPYAEESSYNRARLYYLTDQDEAAVQSFRDFLDTYPESDFSANALYWTGESLYELGQLDEAKRFFDEVWQRYPTSFRVEAARYRSDIVDLAQRENELLRLLQWSHEEYLAALDEFRQKELAYQDALDSYRDRLAGVGATDLQDEVEMLTARVADLESTLVQRDAQISELLATLQGADIRPELLAEISSSGQVEPETTAPETANVDPESASPAGPEEPEPVETTAAPESEIHSDLTNLRAEAAELQRRLNEQGGNE